MADIELNSVNSLINLQQANVSGALKQISSGVRQDSLAQALAQEFETQKSALDVAQQNVAFGNSLLSTSSGALSSIQGKLTQLATLAASSYNGTNVAAVDEYNQALKSIDSSATGAAFNGNNLLSANSQPVTLRTTAQGGSITLQSTPATSDALGLTAVTSTSQINASLQQVLSAINRVSSAQASVAAAQNTLQFAAQVNTTQQIAASQSASVIAGADIAKEVVQASTRGTLEQAAISASITRNSLTKSILKLFK